MNQKISHRRATMDILDLLESWEVKGMHVEECLSAALTEVICATIQYAPTRSAAQKLFDASMEQAIKESETD